MQRVCFILQVKPERIEEYKERHRRVWPEMGDFFTQPNGVLPDRAMQPLEEVFHL